MELDGFIKRDISSEKWRCYVFPSGTYYVIEEPKTLYLKESDTDSHRVIDSEGVVHYIRKNWIAIAFPKEALEF